MSMPGFTAERALAKSANRYSTQHSFSGQTFQGSGVNPQWGSVYRQAINCPNGCYPFYWPWPPFYGWICVCCSGNICSAVTMVE